MAGIPPFARRKSVQLVAVGLAGIAVGAGSGGGSSHQSATSAPAPKPVTVTKTVTKYRAPQECKDEIAALRDAGKRETLIALDMMTGIQHGGFPPHLNRDLASQHAAKKALDKANTLDDACQAAS